MAKQKWIFEATARRIRVEFGGEIIANTINAMLMIESKYDLVYYFPEADVRTEFLEQSDYTKESGYKGLSTFWHVTVGDKVAENAAWTFPKVKDNRPDLRGHIAFRWKAMDHWYEEDEEVFLHPRDPYHRVDTIKSSRHIRVEIDGETVADTTQPVMLFETGLPTRYYIPQKDVRMDLLRPTDTHTICPYKGEASYWSVQINGSEHKDIVWGYPDPISEIPKIEGLVSFYNEKLNIYVDGELEGRPKTVFA